MSDKNLAQIKLSRIFDPSWEKILCGYLPYNLGKITIKFCTQTVPKGWHISVGVFSPTSHAGWYQGGEGTTVIGEKPPTSPSFGSGWHATFIRVKLYL